MEKVFGRKPNFDIEETIFNNIIEKGKQKTNKEIKNILQLIEDEPEIIDKKILSMLILPFLINNSFLRRQKSQKRATKIEVQQSFIVHYKVLLKPMIVIFVSFRIFSFIFQTIHEADAKERTFYETCTSEKLSIQPRIVLVSSPLQLAYITLVDIKYCIQDIKEAVETITSIYLSLNIQYPEISRKVWYFLQRFIFNFKTPFDNVYSDLETLWNDLKK